jgi:hypothetical protein
MATTLETTFNAKVSWSRTDVQALGAASTGRTISESPSSTYQKVLQNGTAASQSDVIYAARHIIPGGGGTPLVLDLNNLAATVFGDAAVVAMVEVTGIHVVNVNLVSGDYVVMGAGSNPFIDPFLATGDGIKIPENGVLCVTSPISGWPVVAGTGDLLQFNTVAANAVTLDIVISGRSA